MRRAEPTYPMVVRKVLRRDANDLKITICTHKMKEVHVNTPHWNVSGPQEKIPEL